MRNWSAKEDSWPRSTLLFFSMLSSSSSSWLTRSGLRALEVFTPGFLLVDDEVIGVGTLQSRYTKMKPLRLIILMIKLRMILKIPLRGRLPPSKNLQVVGRD